MTLFLLANCLKAFTAKALSKHFHSRGYLQRMQESVKQVRSCGRGGLRARRGSGARLCGRACGTGRSRNDSPGDDRTNTFEVISLCFPCRRTR